MKSFIKKEPTFVIAGLAAVISCFFVMPDAQYISYIDFRVLVLLFCLMSAVAGIQKTGFFESLSEKLLSRAGSTRGVCLILVLLTFFSSMLITNDVALITLVPFAVTVLYGAGAKNLIIKTVVLQTVAANLGSMATPVGNPQNLFLYSRYGLNIGEFLGCILPYAAVSLVFVVLCALWGRHTAVEASGNKQTAVKRKSLTVYNLLFLLSILTVLRLVHFGVTAVVTVIVLLITDREILIKTDYCLLLTFVFFFIFSGNLGRIPAVSGFLEEFLSRNTVLAGVVTSQVISNVPAAVLLAPFTDNWQALFAGVNIGGLGTPVASLASLISLKLYMGSEESRGGKYMAVFTAYNIAGLALLLTVYRLI
ncbi:MAG: citrate transporter [Clostridia bacterium]|nr:citrate transporter [Clostridia bacterium]